jgi:cytochrome P450
VTATRETAWERGLLPARTTVVVVSSFFHRDERTLPFADRFTPEIWLDGQAQENLSLIPFSAGPGACPGRNLVLLVAGTLDHSTLRFSVTAR